MANDTKKDRDIESLLLERAEAESDPELDFDRFMKGVVETQERKNRVSVDPEESPQQKYNRLYREKAANRIRVGK